MMDLRYNVNVTQVTCRLRSKPDNLLSLDFSVHNLMVLSCFYNCFLLP